jgi:MFS family permease
MNKNLFIVLLVGFINALSLSIVIPIIYVYAKSYDLNDIEASLLLSVFSIAQFIATPILGRLSDYHGRKPLLIISLIGTVIANIMTAFAPNALLLFVARILDGATGGNNSIAIAVISDTTISSKRAKYFGMFGAMYGIAFIVGPIITYFTQQISLSAPYIVAGLFSSISVICTMLFLPETLKVKEYKKITINDLLSLNTLKGIRLSVIGPIVIVNFFVSLSIGIFYFAFQPYIINKFEKSSLEITQVIIIYSIVAVIIQAGAMGVIAKRFNKLKILITGLIGSGISLLILIMVNDFRLFLMMVPLLALCISVVSPIISTLISINTNPEDQGAALGINESYNSLGTAIGPILGGILITGNISYPIILAATIIIAIAYGIRKIQLDLKFNKGKLVNI